MNTPFLRALAIACTGLSAMAAVPFAETPSAPIEPFWAVYDTLDPDPERFRQEIDAFADIDAKNSSPSDAILFIGSSSARMWKTAEAFPDMATPLLGADGLPDDRYFLPDRLHLNDAGYAVWTTALRPVLIQARSAP